MPIDRRRVPVLIAAIAFIASGVSLHGCGRQVTSKSDVGNKAHEMFDKDGLVNQDRLKEFLEMDAPAREKIDELLRIVKDGPSSVMHAGAVETITLIKDPYRVDALLEIVDTYEGSRTDKNIVRNWAFTGLGLSFEPRAFKKLYELLDTSEDPYELSAILHELGVAAYNAKTAGVELSDDMYNELGEQIDRRRQHKEVSVREHANRAYDRWQRREPK